MTAHAPDPGAGFAGLPGTVVCFSSDDWASEIWTNRQHVMSRLAADQPVLFVQTGQFIGKRLISALRARRHGLHALRMLRGIHETKSPGVSVFTNWNVVPFRQRFRGAMRLNSALNARRLARAIGGPPGTPPIGWVYDVTAARQAEHLAFSLRVYHCVDDYAGYVTDGRRVDLLEHAERLTCDWADLVFTTSEPLAERLRDAHPRVIALGNVADFDHFSQGASDVGEPVELSDVGRPRILFCGSFTQRKVDLRAMGAVASRFPQAALVLIGPITDSGPEFAAELTALLTRPNVHYLGPRDYGRLPALYRECDVGIVPYLSNRYTRGVFPMKVFEYLASGLPVVALGASGFRGVDGPVAVAEIHDEFVEAVGRFLASPSDAGDARGVARRNTWETRLSRMDDAARDFLSLTHPGAQFSDRSSDPRIGTRRGGR